MASRPGNVMPASSPRAGRTSTPFRNSKSWTGLCVTRLWITSFGMMRAASMKSDPAGAEEPKTSAERQAALRNRGRQIALVLRDETAIAELDRLAAEQGRSEEHTSELQSLMRISYAVFCLKKKNTTEK